MNLSGRELWLVLLTLGGLSCSSEVVSAGATGGGGGKTCDDAKASICLHVAMPGGLDTKSDTLPVGACCADESPCQQVVRPCPMGGPALYYTCTCDADAWCCRLISWDASVCTPPGFQPDGGWPPQQQGACH